MTKPHSPFNKSSFYKFLGETSDEYKFTLGDRDSCRLSDTRSITTIDGVVYIGENSGKYRIEKRAHILTLKYSKSTKTSSDPHL